LAKVKKQPKKLTNSTSPSTERKKQSQQVTNTQEDSERVQIQRVVPTQVDKENETNKEAYMAKLANEKH
jgi:hypothetical protein